jgi:acyl-CoA hydrolase
MEIGVKVVVEDLLTGDVQHVSSAYLTFVAIAPDGTRPTLTPVVPETADEQRRFDHAEDRRQYRLARRR